ncbi:hypothetical protein NDU88_006544 [Pleurodeles waltl]|uniref:Uncharacterized protein n=1 Tax=Pleurodeles waltl TaxID=8319 RepID=A0AAV7PRM8_PLEWA|nr:hypothetical protein NDU88_006544 [Pleurodeles waltl]
MYGLEITLDDCATIGCISRPRYLPGFKSRLPLSSDEHDGNRSWEASELATLEDQTIGKTTGTRSSRSVEERSAARIGINENPEDDRRPGKLNGKATTLQEKRGLSRYRERYKEKGRDEGR